MSFPNARDRARRRARAATIVLAGGSVAGLVALVDVVANAATTRTAVPDRAPSAATTTPTVGSTTPTTGAEPSTTTSPTTGSSATSTTSPTTVYSPPVTSYDPPISRSGAT